MQVNYCIHHFTSSLPYIGVNQREHGSQLDEESVLQRKMKLSEFAKIKQRCIQVFKLWGPLDPFLKNLGVHC